MIKVDFDKDADALTLVLNSGKVTSDKQISENLFAGYNKEGGLVELQILELKDNSDVWITVEAAAKILDRSERTILRWIHSGKIRSKKVGREYRIRIDDIEEMAS